MSVVPTQYRPPIEVTFTFPESLQIEVGFKDVTIRELNNAAESQALSGAGQDGSILIHNLVTSALVRATDMTGAVLQISRADDSIDRFMTQIGPKGRALVNVAYGAVNTPKKEETESFLRSAAGHTV